MKTKSTKIKDIEVKNFKELKDGSATFDLFLAPAIDKQLRADAKKAKMTVQKFVVHLLTQYLKQETAKLKLMWNM
ncbi:hypothetical protein HY496_02080 [Candidatus Woesearchaeota archaeon]|nr:hypothetical protein [Candidatus Woesearchaeota archaeon]